MTSTRTPTSPPGVVRADELYTLAELRDRLRLGYKGIATLRRAGLELTAVGRQKFCLGGSVIRLFEKLAEQQASEEGP